MLTPIAPPGGDRAFISTRQVAAVVVGNALEFYDFLTFAFFAIQIGDTFFPSESQGTRLLFTLATFGVGFLTRPLGALVIGGLGDRRGRKPAMLLSFSLMGLAMTGLALTPSYAAIGVAAPILVVLFRLVQGFALGGEIGPTTAYLVEAAPVHRRGFYVSLQSASADGAVLVAGLVGVLLARWMEPAALTAWGWRVAIILGAAIVPVGLLMRRTLVETLDLSTAREPVTHDPARRGLVRVGVLGVLLLASATTANYVMNYMATYANATLHMEASVAFGATAIFGLCSVAIDLVSGWLSDQVGRKPVMLTAWVLLLCAVLPAFSFIARMRTTGALYGATALMSVLLAFGAAPIMTAITESFPPRVRSRAFAITYALAVALFGGTTQFVVTWLIDVTGNPLSPAWYIVGALAVGVAAMVTLEETAPHRSAARASEA